jgi:hypothetical protein
VVGQVAVELVSGFGRVVLHHRTERKSFGRVEVAVVGQAIVRGVRSRNKRLFVKKSRATEQSNPFIRF